MSGASSTELGTKFTLFLWRVPAVFSSALLHIHLHDSGAFIYTLGTPVVNSHKSVPV